MSDAPATPEQHRLVAEAIKARMKGVFPLKLEPDPEFAKAMNEAMSNIRRAEQFLQDRQAPKADA